MEEEPGSPVAGKAEERSGSLLFTYFQGDINSMVDAHFSRALAKATKPKEDNIKSKKIRKTFKSGNEEQNCPNWEVPSHMYTNRTNPSGCIELGRHEEAPTNPRLPLNIPSQSSSIWLSGPRQGTSQMLSPMMYPTAASADGMIMAEQQYTTSLLNLLHGDRPELASVMVTTPKQEFMSGWARHPRFGDQMTPDHSLDTGVPAMERKDLYWY